MIVTPVPDQTHFITQSHFAHRQTFIGINRFTVQLHYACDSPDGNAADIQ